MIIGAILGDIIGSPYEFDMGDKTKDFPLFSERSEYTDDTVMTIAVADAMRSISVDDSDDDIKAVLIDRMVDIGKNFPNCGYGGRFYGWIFGDEHEPYNSWGNGSAMRVSSVGWLFDDIDTVRRMARLSAEVSHNHPEGIKGAESTAAAIYLARTGHSKASIKEYIEQEFEYDLGRTCDEIRPDYHHVEDCMHCVPEAIIAFLEGEDFEDVIRLTVSLGGDTDTLAAISGGIAEAFYGVPDDLRKECRNRTPSSLLAYYDSLEN